MFTLSPFAYITLLIILFMFIKNGFSIAFIANLIVINFFFEVARLRGFFIQIGNGEYYIENAITAISLVVNTLFLMRGKVSLSLIRLSLLSFAIALLGITLEMIFPLSEKILNPSSIGGWDYYVKGLTQKDYVNINYIRFTLFIIQLLYFFSVCIIVKKYMNSTLFSYIYKRIFFLCKLILVSAVIDFLFKYLFGSKLFFDFITLILGDGRFSFKFDDIRDGKIILQGLTREPSNFAYSLFYISIFFFIQASFEKRTINYLCIILSFCLMWISGSFSTVLYIFCFFLFTLMYRKTITESKKVCLYFSFYIILIFIFVIILMFLSTYNSDSFFLSRINNIINSFYYIISDDWKGRLNITSEYVRFIGISDTFKDFLNKPLFGIGGGVELAHSGLITFVSNFGILGTIVWWITLLKISSKKTVSSILLLLILVLPNILKGVYSTFFSVLPIIVSTIYMVPTTFGVYHSHPKMMKNKISIN